MRQQGGIFDRQRPHSREYADTVRAFRNTQREQLESIPSLEELPTHEEAQTYMERCELETAEDKLSHEYALAKKLSEATLERDSEQTESLRRTIWMISNESHQTSAVPTNIAMNLLREKIKTLRSIPIEQRGESEDDIAERIDQHEYEEHIWSALLGALREQATGKDLIRILKAEDEEWGDYNGYDPLADFEYRYIATLRETQHYHDARRKKAVPELESLRIIRDRLYYNLLFPNRASFEYKLENKQSRQQRVH